MIYAVTGSSGFVGYHLLEQLKKQGDEIITIPHQLLSDIPALQYKLRNGFDYIIHLASYGNYYDQTNIDMIKKCNIEYTENLLIAIKDINYKSFVFMSTSSVYGVKDKPMKEDDICIPETEYAIAKLSCEKIVLENKRSVVLRPFTIYGYRDNPKHLIPTVINSIKTQESINIVSDPVHDYIYVKDLVRGILFLKDLKGEIINIGTGKQYSNKDIVQAIELIMEKQALINDVETMRIYDSNKWCADIKKTSKLGFEPYFNLMQGLNETIYEESLN